MRRNNFLLTVLLLCFLLLTACSNNADNPSLSVSLVIIGPEGEILSDSCSMYANDSAADLIRELCDASSVEYTCQSGLFDNFGGFPSDIDKGWLLYVDDELSMVGAEDVTLVDGMQIEFRYTNYEEAFTAFGE